MKLIVGLGNPGREYAGTRHNVGFEVVEQLAKRFAWTSSAAEYDRTARSRFDGLAMDGAISVHSGGVEKILLLKPMTYMNDSGRSVQAALAFYQIEPADMLVVLDDLALPCGKIRLRAGGSSGGHNGLRDIERAIGSDRYPRLRIGIDSPPERVPGKSYVLARFNEEQRKLIDEAVVRATSAAATWIERGIASAMNVFNAEDKENPAAGA